MRLATTMYHPAIVKKLMSSTVLGMALLTLAASSLAADKSAASTGPKWIYPVIPGFGGVHPRPNLPVRPDPKVDYKIFVDLVSDDTNEKGQYHVLLRLARIVNIMAYAGVPSKHVHVVALLDGNKNGYASLNEASFKKMFNKENPNLPILRALKKAGVRIMICSQALAHFDVPDDMIDKSVTVTLSGLTDMIVYGQKGYSFVWL